MVNVILFLGWLYMFLRTVDIKMEFSEHVYVKAGKTIRFPEHFPEHLLERLTLTPLKPVFMC